jgi:uncharacterized protein (UPF0261 family)
MRTNADECAQLGKIIAEKANASTAPVTLLIPQKGISVISTEGQPFHDAAADAALFDALQQHATVPIITLAETINSPVFAKAAAKQLLLNMKEKL